MKRRLLVIFNFCIILCMGIAVNAQENIKSGFVQVENGRIYYEIAGEGAPFVMIHDGLLHRVTWDAQFAEFSKECRVIRYDRRGFGKSPAPTGQYSNIEDLYTLFKELKIDAAIIMGMSAGGGLSIDFTLEYPEMVKALILVGAVVSGYEYTEHFLTRGGLLRKEDWENPELIRKFWFTKDPYTVYEKNVSAREKGYRFLEENPHNMNEDKYKYALEPKRPALGVLHEIKVPVLIVVGEYDIPDCHAHAGVLEAGIKDARRLIIKDAAHHVPTEQPEVLNKAIRTFLKEVEAE